AKLRSDESLCGGSPQRDDNVRFDESDLRLEPRTARSDFHGVGFLVDPAFAPWLPFEVFDNIGDVGLFAIDACHFECAVEQTTGWSNKRFARQIFFVARLLADKHDHRSTRAFSKNCLRSFFPEVAGLAAGRRVFECGHGRPRWN